ncbi:MAG: hypothetical protein E4H02_11005 [Lentisphaerales bacterium]|nr:MAG: hypothetical protein E4H02_11005 [Lentisphaerales bacterium]
MRRTVTAAIAGAVVCLAAISAFGEALSTINSSNKWAWAEGTGWIDCRTDPTNGMIIGQYVCSGHMWNEGVGWIFLGNGNPTNGIRYTNESPEDYGVNHDGKGNLRGYAWSPSAGWIHFEETGAPTVDLTTGLFSGFAWGEGVGWMSFDNLQSYLQTDGLAAGDDLDGDNIPDAWERSTTGVTNLDVIGGSDGSQDSDSDGITDYYEYVGGTDPEDPNDYLKLVGMSSVGGDIQIEWASEETRTYVIEQIDDLTDPAGWTTNILGVISPDAGTNSTEVLSDGVLTQRFYRIKALVPLSE